MFGEKPAFGLNHHTTGSFSGLVWPYMGKKAGGSTVQKPLYWDQGRLQLLVTVPRAMAVTVRLCQDSISALVAERSWYLLSLLPITRQWGAGIKGI